LALLAGVASNVITTAVTPGTNYGNPGPSVVVTAPSNAATSYLVTLTARITGGNNDDCFMSFEVPEINRAGSDATALVWELAAANTFLQASASFVISVSGFTSYTFQAVYKENPGGATCNFQNRSIIVVRTTP
jgi:hypothetical protein